MGYGYGVERLRLGTRLDRFLPRPDVRERHEVVVEAPADLVLEVARRCDIRSPWPVAAIFRMRSLLLGGRSVAPPRGGIVEETRRLGWGTLGEEEGRWYCAGAVCQPWLPDVAFTAVPADAFAAYAEPDRVKIAWTLEAEPLGPARTRFATETRVAATDAAARRRFRSYWRRVRPGVVLIRRFLLSSVRKSAEAAWRASSSSSSMDRNLIRLHHSDDSGSEPDFGP